MPSIVVSTRLRRYRDIEPGQAELAGCTCHRHARFEAREIRDVPGEFALDVSRPS